MPTTSRLARSASPPTRWPMPTRRPPSRRSPPTTSQSGGAAPPGAAPPSLYHPRFGSEESSWPLHFPLDCRGCCALRWPRRRGAGRCFRCSRAASSRRSRAGKHRPPAIRLSSRCGGLAAPYNIGIDCGPARLLVVDLDGPRASPHPSGQNEHGRDVFARLAQAADGTVPPATYTVLTPTGEHRYYRVVPPHLGGTTAGRLGPHIDTRGPGGYVVAAGSVRSVDGRRRYYRTTSPGDVQPAPAPDWLLAALAPATGTGASPLGSRAPQADRGKPEGSVKRVVDRQTRRVEGARPGTRNTVLFTAAVRLGRLVAAGLLDERHATDVLRAASRRHVGVEGFTAAEAERAIANGFRYNR